MIHGAERGDPRGLEVDVVAGVIRDRVRGPLKQLLMLLLLGTAKLLLGTVEHGGVALQVHTRVHELIVLRV